MDTNEQLLKEVRAKANEWLGDGYDDATRAEVKRMLDDSDPTQLIESFYRDLEFGTGGLRGIMGAGTNRMNRYTVGAATQGLANYLNETFKDLPEIRVTFTLENKSNIVAFFIRMAALDSQGRIIKTAKWSDNFFSIEPGHSRTVECRLETAGNAVDFVLEGWNVPHTGILIKQ